jgi:nucleoside-diphosphate-sugar epimerase
MHILLTGASGWLGRVLAPMLREAGHKVVGLDVVHGPETDVVGSVVDPWLVHHVIASNGIDSIVHAGALHKPDMGRYAADAFVEVNVTGTLNLLEAAVAAGVERFVFTSTTSLMISADIRAEKGNAAVWLDEATGPLAPRNIYGATKLAAENLCRIHHLEHGLNCIVLRTARFFPEEDDTDRGLAGQNLKANEFLHRRLTVEDAACAHVSALEQAPCLGFDLFLVSAPTPFARSDARALKDDAASVVGHYHPDAAALYAERGWQLPASISRVYDSRRAEDVLGFRCATDFGAILDALRAGEALPFAHDPAFGRQQGEPTPLRPGAPQALARWSA